MLYSDNETLSERKRSTIEEEEEEKQEEVPRKKQKLSPIEDIIDNNNYRNMDIDEIELDDLDRMIKLIYHQQLIMIHKISMILVNLS